ncbi:MAG: response regulator [Pseudomonadota bacterium]
METNNSCNGTVRPPVLIVDDDPTNLFVLGEFVRAAGFTTVTATNGAEAVDASRQHQPALILMDLSMPVMDGFEATRRILSASPEEWRPVVLAVSANVTPEWRASCFEAGMEDFVEKPVDFDRLVEQLKALYSRLGF